MAIVRYGGVPTRYSPSLARQLDAKLANTMLYDVPMGIAKTALKLPIGEAGQSFTGAARGGSGQATAAQGAIGQLLGDIPKTKLMAAYFQASDEEKALMQQLYPLMQQF